MKVIGIGLPRTGTSSLYEALCILGYKTVHNPVNLNDFLTHDAFVDGTTAFGYNFLDCYFPDSKFIYTERDPEQWFESLLSYFQLMMFDGGLENDLSQKIFLNNFKKNVVRNYDKDYFIKKYIEHNKRVLDYFDNRKDFLALDITDENDNWSAICNFLGNYVPDVEFPRTNSKNDRWQSLASIF